MSAAVARNAAYALIEQIVVNGDLSRLTPEQRLTHYNRVCESVGLNPLTRPFEYITLNGRLVLYAKRDATDQLRRIYEVSTTHVDRKEDEEFHTVIVRGQTKAGRQDEACGVVVIKGLKGLDLANARMKAETKAKRRLALSICGLGMLDETEVEDIPERNKGGVFPTQPEPGDGIEDLGWVCPVGTYAKRRFEEISIETWSKWVLMVEARAKKEGKPLNDLWQKTVDYLSEQIGLAELAEINRDREPGEEG